MEAKCQMINTIAFDEWNGSEKSNYYMKKN